MSDLQNYVSNELTHFVGRNILNEDEQCKLLVEILNSGRLTYPPHFSEMPESYSLNLNEPISENKMYLPGVICFCDIPINELKIHIAKYSCFGLSFLKTFLVENGANPVFYITKNSNITLYRHIINMNNNFCDRQNMGKINRAEYFDNMIIEFNKLMKELSNLKLEPNCSEQEGNKLIERITDVSFFLEYHIFSFVKFFNSDKTDDDPDNYYMEREWRILGNLNFKISDVERVILPKKYEESFRNDVQNYSGHIKWID